MTDTDSVRVFYETLQNLSDLKCEYIHVLKSRTSENKHFMRFFVYDCNTK